MTLRRGGDFDDGAATVGHGPQLGHNVLGAANEAVKTLGTPQDGLGRLDFGV